MHHGLLVDVVTARLDQLKKARDSPRPLVKSLLSHLYTVAECDDASWTIDLGGYHLLDNHVREVLLRVLVGGGEGEWSGEDERRRG